MAPKMQKAAPCKKIYNRKKLSTDSNDDTEVEDEEMQ